MTFSRFLKIIVTFKMYNIAINSVTPRIVFCNN